MPAKQDREYDHDGGGNQKDLENGEPLTRHHVVDVGALRREHERAAHRAEALHRHRDRNNDVAAIGDAHLAGILAVERLRDLLVALAAVGAEFAVERQIAPSKPRAHLGDGAPDQTGFRCIRRRQIEAQYFSRAVQILAVDQENTVAVINARARFGGRDKAAQDRRHALRIDGKIDAVKRILGRTVALTGLQALQLARIDGDR